jgi:hypothetical protein
MNITEEEHNSLKFYQDSGFYLINTYLRENKFDSTRHTIEKIQNDIKNIDNLFLKSKKSDTTMTIYRGAAKLHEGTNLGYVSTTTNLSIGKKFAGSAGVVCELHVAPNIPYIDINTWNNRESEILLPRGLKFTVKSCKITKKSKYYTMDVSL